MPPMEQDARDGDGDRDAWGWSPRVGRLLAGAVALAALALAARSAALPRSESGSGPPVVLRVDVNRADAALLAALPGIGPGRARAIVAARGERPLASLGDLDRRVAGLGARTLEGIAPFVRFPGEPPRARD
jgi:competence protein ComEA